VKRKIHYWGRPVEVELFDVPPEKWALWKKWDRPEDVMRRKAEKKNAAQPPARKAS
jgi:hypothetical protein